MKTLAIPLSTRTFSRRFDDAVRNWTYADLYADREFREDWISFDCLLWHPAQRALFVGLTRMNGDIFYRFDPSGSSGVFTSLDFRRVADRFDAKFHRSLELDTDGSIWAATALLHDVDLQGTAAGGKLIHYDVGSNELMVASIPVPGQYIQGIKLDSERRLIYGFTYPGEFFFRYDIETGFARRIAFIGNGQMICQPHGFVVDGAGDVWGTWGESRAYSEDRSANPIRFFRYDAIGDTIEYLKFGAPVIAPGDDGHVDHMLQLADGSILIGTTLGSLALLDPSTESIRYLGKPFAGPRVAGMTQLADGRVLVAGNCGIDRAGKGTARLALVDVPRRQVEDLGPIWDADRGDGACIIHQLVPAEGNVVYAGENDNPTRAAFLWRIELDL